MQNNNVKPEARLNPLAKIGVREMQRMLATVLHSLERPSFKYLHFQNFGWEKILRNSH